MAQVDADLLILGAGPAGLSAAQYGGRANLKVLAIEQMSPGGQALVINKLENYPGDATPRSGFDFAQDMRRQAEKFGAKIIGDAVLSLKKEGGLFIAGLGSGKELRAYAVILATGATHRRLGISGEAEYAGRGVSYCATCDGPFFKGKKVLVVGGGDAACDEAWYLSLLTDQVILVHRRDTFRAQQGLAQRVLRNPHIDVRLNTRPLEIRGDKQVTSILLENTAEKTQYEEPVSAVFIFVGTNPQTALVPDVKTDETGYIITDQRMASSIPGLFAAGDVRSSPFRQVVVAAAEGAIAAHCAAEYIDTLKS
ncbi:thioredoxin-disulfide reductase [Treponema primitia]|uniref:thioredoxin-disulfide reductase n=1 Tax=Treponema primitia TaxID=88058 RepID=UPI0039801253